MIGSQDRALVTGGGGFLGSALVDQLRARGATVRTLQRSVVPSRSGVEAIQGDITDAAIVARACAGCSVVFHVAAKAGVFGRYDDYHRANVVGTQCILDACRRQGVGRLVYTSTPSVVYDRRPLRGADESTPYARHFETAYAQTKALAEQAVLSANGSALATIALRPHLIWGPGDTNLIPRLVARSRSGRLARVGAGANIVDVTYIDNVVAAHLLAGDRLTPSAALAGKAYFITNDEPIKLWAFIDQVLTAVGAPTVQKSMPFSLAYAVGAGLEFGSRILGRTAEPVMTRFVARQLATDHWFDITAARRDLGYDPTVTIAEGLQRLAEASAVDRV